MVGSAHLVHLALNYTPVYTAHCKKEGEITSLRPPWTAYFIAESYEEKRWEHREKPLSAICLLTTSHIQQGYETQLLY